MSRYVFIALAALMGVVVGLPQHRYQPYQFPFTAGKQDSVTGDLNSAASINVPTTYEEHTRIPNQRQVSAGRETPAIHPVADQTTNTGQVNHLWHKAAKNLINIPHLLRWVSSLNPETLMDTLKQQQRSPEPQQFVPVATEKNNPALGQGEKNRPTVEQETKNYDPNYLTEEPKEETESSRQRPQAASRAGDPNQIVTQEQKHEPEQRYQPEEQHHSGPLQQHARQEYGQNERVFPSTKPHQAQIAPDQSPAGEKQEEPSKRVAPTRPKTTVETDTKAMVVAPHPRQTEHRPHHEVNPVEQGQKHPLPQEKLMEQVRHRDTNQQPLVSTFEKTTFGGRKKSFFKLKNNKQGHQKQLQTVKRGKTLIQASPALTPRQDSFFTFDSFSFPAYSYSVSHTPSHNFFTGR